MRLRSTATPAPAPTQRGADRLAAETEALARTLLDKPPVPVAITKEHVNAVARTMGAGLTAFADGDVLLGVASDPESRAAARAYLRRLGGRGKTVDG